MFRWVSQKDKTEIPTVIYEWWYFTYHGGKFSTNPTSTSSWSALANKDRGLPESPPISDLTAMSISTFDYSVGYHDIPISVEPHFGSERSEGSIPNLEFRTYDSFENQWTEVQTEFELARDFQTISLPGDETSIFQAQSKSFSSKGRIFVNECTRTEETIFEESQDSSRQTKLGKVSQSSWCYHRKSSKLEELRPRWQNHDHNICFDAKDIQSYEISRKSLDRLRKNVATLRMTNETNRDVQERGINIGDRPSSKRTSMRRNDFQSHQSISRCVEVYHKAMRDMELVLP